MAIKALHALLDARAENDPVVEKLLHDYPILLRRIQSWQESLAAVMTETGTYSADEIKEMSDLEKHIDSEVIKKARSEG